MSHVFISHATADKRTTQSVCKALNAAGVPTWVSFDDIRAGSFFDEAIENALEKSIAVIVIVSPGSVTSKYVRAEVSWAINKQKTVIPVVVKKVERPVQWQMLQYVKWDSKKQSAVVRQIIAGLPTSAVAQLNGLLRDRSKSEDVRELILRHREWLPIEFNNAAKYTYKTRVSVSGGSSPIDCFAARLDSFGPRATLYYLGSPYNKPFTAAGTPSSDLRTVLRTVKAHRDFLGNPFSKRHRIAPAKFYSDDFAKWAKEFQCYKSLKIFIISGRRTSFGRTQRDARDSLVSKLNRELFPSQAFLGSGLEMMTYDRLVEAIDPSSTGGVK